MSSTELFLTISCAIFTGMSAGTAVSLLMRHYAKRHEMRALTEQMAKAHALMLAQRDGALGMIDQLERAKEHPASSWRH